MSSSTMCELERKRLSTAKEAIKSGCFETLVELLDSSSMEFGHYLFSAMYESRQFSADQMLTLYSLNNEGINPNQGYARREAKMQALNDANMHRILAGEVGPWISVLSKKRIEGYMRVALEVGQLALYEVLVIALYFTEDAGNVSAFANVNELLEAPLSEPRVIDWEKIRASGEQKYYLMVMQCAGVGYTTKVELIDHVLRLHTPVMNNFILKPLMNAAFYQSVSVVKQYLDKGFEPNVTQGEIIAQAIKSGCSEKMRVLIKAGCLPSMMSEEERYTAFGPPTYGVLDLKGTYPDEVLQVAVDARVKSSKLPAIFLMKHAPEFLRPYYMRNLV